METISSIRFSFTREGALRAEMTVAYGDGKASYPRLSNAADAIRAGVLAGADIRGYERVITLKNPDAIRANGGSVKAKVAEYATTPVRATVTLLGDYAEVDCASIKLAGATAQNSADIKTLVNGVALQPVAERVKAQKPADETVDLG